MSSRSKSSKSSSSSSSELSSVVRWLQHNVASNRRCVECHRQGVTSVDLTTGSFVCTRCAGVLRGVPHKVKSVAMSSFTHEEMDFLRCRGNDWARKVYLGLLTDNELLTLRAEGDEDETLRKRISDKYERRRYAVDASNVPFSKVEVPSNLLGNVYNENNGSKSSMNSSGGAGRHAVQAGHFIGAALNAKLGSSHSPGSDHEANLTVLNSKVVRRANSPAALNTVGLPKSSVLANAVQMASNDASTRKSSTSSSRASQENFADFDTARFDQPVDLIAAPPRRSESAKLEPTTLSTRHSAHSPPILASTKQMPTPQEDRYAALKDLDDLFKTNINVDTDNAQGNSSNSNVVTGSSSTGASIFGVSGFNDAFGTSNSHNHANAFALDDRRPTEGTKWPEQGQWPGHSANGQFDNSDMRMNDFSGVKEAQPIKERHVPFNPFVNMSEDQGGRDGDSGLNTSPWPSAASSTTPAPTVTSGFVADFGAMGNEVDNSSSQKISNDLFSQNKVDFFDTNQGSKKKETDFFGNNTDFFSNTAATTKNTDLLRNNTTDLFGNNNAFTTDPFATNDTNSGWVSSPTKSADSTAASGTSSNEVPFDAFFNTMVSTAPTFFESEAVSKKSNTSNFANFEHFEKGSNPWKAFDMGEHVSDTKLESQSSTNGLDATTLFNGNNPFL